MVKLSCRLQAAADLVRDGARLADVGCDHGYVPVSLVLSGKIPAAVASDINEGPLQSCANLVREYALEDNIRCVLSDGLQEVNSEDVDDILIAGMGGEMIAKILSACPWAKEKHLVLNAMTHTELAREWLFENGFAIQNDIIVKEGRHYYSVLDAVYTGENTAYAAADCYLGNINDFTHKEYFVHLLNYLRNKQKSGEDLSGIITAIEEKL